VMERVLDEISFAATEHGGDPVVIDGPYVRARVEDLSKDQDLSRFIL
jgi:ATP-dependent HslUV protease ATP-binding subunit HslU